jgi:hypothetical protein
MQIAVSFCKKGKPMKRKILTAAIVTALMLSSLTACGEDVNLPTSSDTTQSSTVESESKESNTESGAETSTPESNTESSTPESSTPPENTAPAVDVIADGMFTDRDMKTTYEGALTIELADSGTKTTANGVAVDGNTVTIAREGVYLVKGSLSDGQIIVQAGSKDKVQIVLDNASITKNGGATIQVKSADKVFITTKEGTQNTLSSKGNFGVSSDNVDGTVFSKSDVVLNGAGSLKIESETAHAIVSKDNLKIANGTYDIKSAKQGLSGKDSIRIAGGNITVNSGKDALHSENTEDSAKGYIYIAGGNLQLTSTGDSMDASGKLDIKGGNINILSGGGADNGKSQDSCKGIKADGVITVSNGTFNINCLDDAIHGAADVNISGGNIEIQTGDDAIHSDLAVNISGGKINGTDCYEGIEGLSINISGGETRVVTSDDGLNAAGGNDGSGMDGQFKPGGFGGGMENDPNAGITVSGGKLTVVARGDGIDSNGSFTMTGGEVYVSGPENGGNGSLDYGGNATISGGIFIAAGSNGMAQNFSETSTQGVIMGNANGNAGDEISIVDNAGKVLASYTAELKYQNIVISAPGMVQGGTYTLKNGGQNQEITLDKLVYGGSNFGFGGGPGGHKPGRGEDFPPIW